MKWTIRKVSDDRYLIVDQDDQEKGDITQRDTHSVWRVTLLAAKLNFQLNTFPEAVAYVKGVENTVRVCEQELDDRGRI